jgi:hypothetical protein
MRNSCAGIIVPEDKVLPVFGTPEGREFLQSGPIRPVPCANVPRRMAWATPSDSETEVATR